MKNAWILNHYATEPVGTGSTRHFSIAKYLKDHGWNTTVIAASVEHATGRQRIESSALSDTQEYEGVGFLWLKTPRYTGNGLSRMLNMLVYTFLVLLPGTTRAIAKPDVIIGSSVHPFAVWAASRLAARFKVPFIFEIRDLWPQTLVDMKRIEDTSWMARFFYWLELSLFRKAARIITLLPGVAEYIAAKAIDPGKVVWIPNAVDLDKIQETGHRSGTGEFILMYIGAHGQANGLDTLIEALALLEKQPLPVKFHCRLIGNGPLKEALVERSRKLGLTSVSFEPAVPKAQVVLVASEADAFVITVQDLPELYRYGISMNKLYDYMAMGKPVIIAADAFNNPVEESGGGLSVEPESPPALAEAIEKLVCLPEAERRQMGDKAQAYVHQHHSYKMLAKKIAAVLDELAQ